MARRGEKPLTAAQFLKRMKLQSVNADPDGSFAFWHDDGDLFWGHSIQVTGNLKGRPDGGGHAGVRAGGGRRRPDVPGGISVARDDRAHEGHRLTAEKLSKKLDAVRRTGGKILFLHERELDDGVLAAVLGDAALRPLPTVTLLQLQSNPRLTSGALHAVARVAGAALPALEEINVSYTAVTDLSPLASIRTSGRSTRLSKARKASRTWPGCRSSAGSGFRRPYRRPTWPR